MSVFGDFQRKAYQLGAPVSVGIVVVLAVAFVVQWLAFRTPLAGLLAFNPSTALAEPWTFLTYPLAASLTPFGLLSIVFAGLWLWGIGASVEREIGSRTFGIFWLLFTLLPAVMMLLGAILVGGQATILGPWIPLSAVTVVWGTRNPNTPITFMFVLPLTGRWLAWLAAGLILVGTPMQLVPFAAVPLILAWAYAANRLPIAYGKTAAPAKAANRTPMRGGQVYDKRYFDDVKRREQERQERERLRQLFERSLIEDPDDGPDSGRGKGKGTG